MNETIFIVTFFLFKVNKKIRFMARNMFTFLNLEFR